MKILSRSVFFLVIIGLSGILVQSWPTSAQNTRIMTTNDCIGPVDFSIAAEENGPYSQLLTIPRNSRRYYVNIGIACSTHLAVEILYCPLTLPNCNNQKIINSLWKHAEWGVFRTDANGIARIDFDDTHQGYYTMRVQPIDPYEVPHSNLWSTNTVTLVIDGWNTNTINYRDYFLYDPGATYQYTTNYYYTPLPNAVLSEPLIGHTRIQIEAERIWADYRVRHWRYSKDRAEAYWFPYIPLSDGTVLWSGNETLRWPIVADSFNATTEPISNFNSFVWGLGERRYDCIGGCNFDNPAPNPIRWYSVGLRGDADGLVPALTLGPEQFTLPYSYLSYGRSNITSHAQLNAFPNPSWSCGREGLPACTQEHSWRFRIEQMPTSVVGFDDVLRIDWYETYAGPNSILRESWFMARDVGLIKIQQVFFGDNTGRSAVSDPDFLSDSIVNPDVEVVLDGAYLPANHPIAKTSTTPNRADAAIISCLLRPAPNTTPTFDYHLWLSNTANAGTTEYTGYVSVYDFNTNQLHEKRFWVDQGHAVITLPADIPLGSYTANLNIWHPNDLFPNETFAGVQIPARVASNDYTIQIVDDLSQCASLNRSIQIPMLIRK